MFMQIAIGAIGIGVVLMVGYLVIAQVRAALPASSDGNVTAGLASTQATVFAGTTALHRRRHHADRSPRCSRRGSMMSESAIQKEVAAPRRRYPTHG